jgi:hypothetical protein
MQVMNRTKGGALGVPVRDAQGREWLAVMVKFELAVDARGRATLVEKQSGPRLVDEYWGEPGTSSIRCSSELCDVKPGTEVFLVGHAHPAGARRTSVDVRLQVGPIDKTLRVHGLRAFQKGASGSVVPGPARPLTEPVPLKWELAYGGVDLSPDHGALVEPRNHLGTGVAHDPARLVGTAAPQIEYPDAPSIVNGGTPAGFAPIHRHWQPRVSYVGTYDAVWEKTRMPLMPVDFDNRYYLSAPADQWCASPLRGDEPFLVTGATPEGVWRFQLPRFTLGVRGDRDGVGQSHRVQLDTIVVDADRMRVELLFRTAIALPAKYQRLGMIHVVEKNLLRAAS